MNDHPHRRYNPLTAEWVLVSPHRAQRPWLGQVEKTPNPQLPIYDPTCYLCPGNARAGGIINPSYTSTFVFDNDFAALRPAEGLAELQTSSGLFQVEAAAGQCRVVCFSPRHDLTLPELPLPNLEAVIHTWAAQTRELAAQPGIRYVQVFENKGEMMGCSNPHPHSQIWASSYLPNELEKELRAQQAYHQQHRACLLCDYVHAELQHGERVVAANAQFVAVVPFWAVWPFELLVAPIAHHSSLVTLDAAHTTALAEILQRVTARYDNLFEISFPYSMGFHSAPAEVTEAEWHLHAHFYPPLLRSATVKKFMVGYEMLAMPQRDLTPETAAERLRSVSERHYRASA